MERTLRDVGELEPERVTADLNATYAYVNPVIAVVLDDHVDRLAQVLAEVDTAD